MSEASIRNFGLEQRQRERRNAYSVLNPGVSGNLPDPAWDSFFGSIAENGPINFGSIRSGRGPAMARPGDEETARSWALNTALSDLQDERRFKEQALRSSTADASRRESAARMEQQQAEDVPAIDRAFALSRSGAGVLPADIVASDERGSYASRQQGPIADPRAVMQANLPGHLQPAPPKAPEPTPIYREWLEVNKDRQTRGEKPLTLEEYQDQDANRKKTPANDAIDPTAIAEQIMAGNLPPKISDYGRSVQGAVATALAKNGYSLASAVTDWNATQKHIASMNGAQQLRLNQAVNQLPEMLDTVESLSSQWKGGKFPILNKANLALAKGGAYGSDVASVATQLDTMIADITADLGTVYMGGNSPTDHGLSLAGKNLSSDWDEKVLKDAIELARKNVRTRQNSIRSTGVAGASDTNPYATPASGRGAAPPPTSKQSGNPFRK
jgi:hypothetical protein